MDSIVPLIGIIGILLLAFAVFCVYFIFKQIEFVLLATNLYRKMITRQDATIQLLIDIRDHTTTYGAKNQLHSPGEPLEFCYHCGAKIIDVKKPCPSCGKTLQ